MKAFCRFISFVLFLLIGIIVLLNISNTIFLETSFLSLRANVGFLILASSVLASLATIFLLISFGLSSKSEKDKFKKQIETTKLNYETESDKVKQLEAKIKTLEEALKQATRK